MTHPALASTLDQIAAAGERAGELKKVAKAIKADQALAEALWATGEFTPRLVAVLLMERTALSEGYLEGLAADLDTMDKTHRTRISEWLLGNQLTKHKSTQALLESWADHPSPTLRRLYWYAQARQRWTGRTPPPENSGDLVDQLETKLADEHPDVQWAMNFCAGWIGVFEPAYRDRLMTVGKNLGLYEGIKVPKNCTPDYLPEFIRIEVEKRA